MDIGLAESLAKALEGGQHEDIKLLQPLPIPQQELSGAFDAVPVATRYDMRKFLRATNRGAREKTSDHP